MPIKPLLRILALILLLMLPLSAAQADEPPRASDPAQDQSPDNTNPDCRECHWDVYLNWEQSAHGRGLSCGQCHLSSEEDHARQGHGAQGGAQACMSCHTTGYDAATDTWKEDNVHCTACHSPVTQDHPENPMPTSRSETLCGQCHIQAHFEWRNSDHGVAGVTCVSCHSQHTTSLKSSTISAQCATCHEAKTEGYSHSVHSDAGLSCANCHLAPLDGPVGEGSAKRNHSFHVAVETCVACHEGGLHDYPVAARYGTSVTFLTPPTSVPDAMASAVNEPVTTQPAAASPVGFVALGGVIAGLGLGGLIVGMLLVLIPWVTHRSRRRPKNV